jgi:choline-sulfatase
VTDQPNILIVMGDEHSPFVSSTYGHPFVTTPGMDRLAAQGAVFEAAYCNSPICAPSRASFNTGKQVHRIGVWDHGSVLPSDEPTWAHRLNAAGYTTAAIGRMHFNGPDNRHGFQHRSMSDAEPVFRRRSAHALRPANWDNPGKQPRGLGHLESGPGDSPYQLYDDQVLESARDYLAQRTRSTQPWAAFVSFITPHYPLIVREEYWNRYFPDHADLPEIPVGPLHPQHVRQREFWGCIDADEETIRRARAAYYGLVSFTDDHLSALLDELERQGLADSTVVAYVSDHGELNGDHGLWCKYSFYEGSARIPMIVSWPGRFREGARLKRIVSLVDLTRTVVELGGAVTEDLDGANLMPLLAGDEADGGGEAFSEYEAQIQDRPARMIRRGRYKLNYYFNEPVELFDLEDDPHELTDLVDSEEHREVVVELTAAVLEGWDPDEIDRRVRADQRKRRLVHAGHPTDPDDPWFLGAGEFRRV